MTDFTRLLVAGLAVVALSGAAHAQDNFDAGKTGAQLFASDCAICHKSAQKLRTDGGGLFGLSGFLREHYTSSRQSASAIAAYLESVHREPAGPRRDSVRAHSRSAGEPKAHRTRSADKKTAGGKAAEAKPPAKKDEP
jgi:mono/diheme cytochrome c family protein